MSAARARGVVALLSLALLTPGSASAAEERLFVLAAASLRNALDDAASQYAGAKPVISYAGSSALARQIERGAPASLVLCADRDWMDYLEARGLIERDTRRDLLGNRLALIAPRESKTELRVAPAMPLARSLGGGRLAIGDPAHVPAGKYARAALERLGVWSAVRDRVAATENVRVALALVARGEAPLGIVYETDARAEPSVRVLDRFDASLHPPIVYPMALVKGASPAAREFATHLKGEAARRIFEKHGFTPLN